MTDLADLSEEEFLALMKKSRDERNVVDRRIALDLAGAPFGVINEPFKPPRWWPDPALAGWKGEPWSVTLWGPAGVGKTMLATELWSRVACDPEVRTLAGTWRRASEIPGIYFGSNGESPVQREARSAAWWRLLAAPAVLVDDLGRGHPGGGWEALDELIALREADRLPTLITTNLAPAAIERHSTALYDRLRTGIICEMKGRSQRRRKR